MKKVTAVFILILMSLVSLIACGGRNSASQGNANVQFEVSAETDQVGETMLRIGLQDSAGNPIDDATLSVKGDMTHAGMQPVLADEAVYVDGAYAVPFEWTMSGDWFLTIEAELADGTLIVERVDGFEISE